MNGEKARELGIQYFNNGNRDGFSCAESTLMVISEAMNLNSELIPKIATPFAAGMCHRQQTCGAVSGSLMGIGAVLGRIKAGASREQCYEMCKALISHVEETYGTTDCRTLLGLDLRDKNIDKVYRNNQFKSVCAPIVGDCCQYVVEQLNKLR